jgi:hypothetical protein
MDSKRPIETALRILASWTSGRHPEALDLQELQAAYPQWKDLAPDELACRVVQAYSERVFRAVMQERGSARKPKVA